MAKKNREQIKAKFGGRCAYCGCELPEKGWRVDHAEPIIRLSTWCKETGKYKSTGKCEKPHNENEANYMPSCASCNIAKSTLNIEDFRAFITRFVDSLNKYSVQYKVAKRYGLIKETGIGLRFYFEIYEAN